MASSYRSFHRQALFGTTNNSGNNYEGKDDTDNIPIWSLAASSHTKKRQFIWTASGDGKVRGWSVTAPKRSNNTNNDDSKNPDLTAKALNIECVCTLVSQEFMDSFSSNDQTSIFACTVVAVLPLKGPKETLLVASLDLAGSIKIWVLDIDEVVATSNSNEKENKNSPLGPSIPALYEFVVDNATGTTLDLVPPSAVSECPYVLVAVGCLHGSVALVSTGVLLLQQQQQQQSAAEDSKKKHTHQYTALSTPGHVYDTLGPRGAAVPLCLTWHNSGTDIVLAVGRQDGTIDLISLLRSSSHRIWPQPFPATPVRALCFTGGLLVAGNDDGLLRVWDIFGRNGSSNNNNNNSVAPSDQQQQSRRFQYSPVLVHHVLQAHNQWILHLCSPYDEIAAGSNDNNNNSSSVTIRSGRRFITNGTDKQIHVWHLMNQLDRPVHSFQTDQAVWACTTMPDFRQEYAVNNTLSGVGGSVPPLLITASDQGFLQVFTLEK